MSTPGFVLSGASNGRAGSTGPEPPRACSIPINKRWPTANAHRHRRAGDRRRGDGRYLRGLLTEWTADDNARQHQFVLYAPKPFAVSSEAQHFTLRSLAGSSGVWWEQMRLPAAARRDDLDV